MSTMLSSADFIVDKVEYSPGAFLDQFSSHLPRLVKVTKGYYGDEQIKTFEIGQALFIRKSGSQERVVASVLRGPSSLAHKLLSIPLDYNANFSLVSKKKGNKKYNLRRVLSKGGLPTDVIFIPEIASSDSSVPTELMSTDDSLVLRLAHQYRDTFLFGHALSEDKVTSIVQQLPLFLTKLRVSLVVGRAGYGTQEWKNYLDALDEICTHQIKSDNYVGNPDIALYDGNENDFDATVQVPRVYCTIYDCLSNSNLYQTLQEPQSESTPSEERVNTYEVVACCSQEAPLRSTKNKPSIPPKPQKKTNMRRTLSSTNISGTGEEALPDLPPRSCTTRQKKTKDRPSILEFNNEYEDICVFSRENFFSEKKEKEDPFFPRKTGPAEDKVPQLPPRNGDRRGKRLQKTPTATDVKEKIEEMSIQDVSNVLHNLKLGSYIPVFQEQWIDGAILRELNVDILHLECGMKKVEAIRLMTFVRKGHIPE